MALDERGEQQTSRQFAAHIQKWRNDGTREVAFVIGGANGLHETVLSGAQMIIAFGRQTWPHLIARGLLIEQIYRAQTIISGHPYHRD